MENDEKKYMDEEKSEKFDEKSEEKSEKFDEKSENKSKEFKLNAKEESDDKSQYTIILGGSIQNLGK